MPALGFDGTIDLRNRDEGRLEHNAADNGAPLTQRGPVALLVDGDNMSADRAGRVLTRAAGLGSVIVKRVFAAAPHIKGWEKSYGFSIRYAQGAKNATDILMTIEAVELAHRTDLKAFVLASSDRDFAPLARWLVERGLFVLGLGGPMSPIDWQKSCSRFEIVDEPKPPPVRTVAASGPENGEARSMRSGEKPKSPSESSMAEQALSATDSLIRRIIQTEGQAGSIEIGRLGITMGTREKMTLGSLGVANWRSYLASKPGLYHLDPKGPNARVRWKGQ